MLAGVYLSFGPLLGLGLFPELFTNWNCLSFLSTDLLRSSWIEPSPRSSPPSFPFLLRSISFFFSSLLIARLFDLLSCWMVSAHWSATLHQQPCLLSPTPAPGRVCVDPGRLHVFVSQMKWVALSWMSVLKPCYAGWGEASAATFQFTTDTQSLWQTPKHQLEVLFCLRFGILL